jgi:hypothetical protein
VPAAGPGAGPADARAAAAGPAPIAAEALMTHVRALAADSMEGRAIGTPGGERARAYVLRAFRDAGLRPFGDAFEAPFATAGRDGRERRGVNVVGHVRGRTNPSATSSCRRTTTTWACATARPTTAPTTTPRGRGR